MQDDVSDQACESPGILHCVLDAEVEAGKVHCYIVYLSLVESRRGRQIDLLIQKVLATAPAGDRVFLNRRILRSEMARQDSMQR